MSTALHITLKDFLARPERDDGYREELIEGEVIVPPGATFWHGDIVDRLGSQLAPVKERGCRLANDFSCLLGWSSMPVPDLAAISEARCDQAIKNDGWIEGSPELVAEVMSPSNRNLERKAALYLDHGAEQVWLVYRETRTVVVFASKSITEAHIGDTLEFQGVPVKVASSFPAR